MKDTLYKSWLQCSEGCPPHYDLTEIIYQCPACGNLLEVKHDLERLRTKSGREWRTTFETRTNQSTGPYSSGVWSRKEWVCPEMDDRDIVTIGEGRTPIFDAKNLAKKTGIEKVWIKLCGNSHTGSFKDLGMTVLVSMVKRMIARGQPIKAVACASTGDTSARAGALDSVTIKPQKRLARAFGRALHHLAS